MKFFRDLKTDYLESRFSAYESFAEWFLKRKLGFWGSGKELDWSKRVPLTSKQKVRAKIVHWTILLPRPHSSKGSVNLLRLEMKRTLFATVVRSDLECETRIAEICFANLISNL
ncbi:TPA: hypothetical protein U1V53_001484 [Streptococcus suis]|nr:hypothetical protein [Streptococcus suis]HEM3943615.1 hypothetical protein [Streptococcus suis]HEM3949708.1 hypothetical protein [Streptococcus suis]HEM3953607.1 hypothetical protein [Streptococcus suis]HEM3955676.1 hypothetical protein [Streptococcus suis]